MAVLLIDTANVLGSRPDGWWRDRVGATGRLLSRLAALPGATLVGPEGVPMRCTSVLAVLEGRAREAQAPVGAAEMRLLRAVGSGDDALAAAAHDEVAAGRAVVAVTADRGLRARLPSGVVVVGPGWLFDQLA